MQTSSGRLIVIGLTSFVEFGILQLHEVVVNVGIEEFDGIPDLIFQHLVQHQLIFPDAHVFTDLIDHLRFCWLRSAGRRLDLHCHGWVERVSIRFKGHNAFVFYLWLNSCTSLQKGFDFSWFSFFGRRQDQLGQNHGCL